MVLYTVLTSLVLILCGVPQTQRDIDTLWNPGFCKQRFRTVLTFTHLLLLSIRANLLLLMEIPNIL